MNRTAILASLAFFGVGLYWWRSHSAPAAGSAFDPARELGSIFDDAIAWARAPIAALQSQPAAVAPVSFTAWDDVVTTISDSVAQALNTGPWQYPDRAAPYVALIEAAELRHGIPPRMLGRLLYQESRFREDIITGRVRSPAGAVGIAQFMPGTSAELGIDPLDPPQAIEGAARYLRRLYNALGDWKLALAAYNWGIGNLQRRGIDAAPAETRAYYGDILRDVGLA